METITGNTNSWYYKLAKFGNNKRDVSNRCSFVWSAFFGLIVLIFVATIVGLIAASFGNFFAWVLSGILYIFVMFNEGAIPAICITTLIFMVLVLAGLDELDLRYIQRTKNEPPTPPGFIKQVYLGWKNKYCAHIDWREF